jgi:hypothetical protein
LARHASETRPTGSFPFFNRALHSKFASDATDVHA